MPTDSIEDGVRRIAKISRQFGLAPLSTEEIYKILKQVTPPKAINGLKSDRVIDPNQSGLGLGAEADPRNAMFNSSVPMRGAIGPAMPADDIQGEGFSGALPMISDPSYFRHLRRMRAQPPQAI